MTMLYVSGCHIAVAMYVHTRPTARHPPTGKAPGQMQMHPVKGCQRPDQMNMAAVRQDNGAT